MHDRLDQALKNAADGQKVPGVAAIALDRSGKVLYKGAFGTNNLTDTSAPSMTSSTNVMLWSCAKLVTAVCALQLLEQGKLKLDDPVEQYVPEIAKINVLDGFDDAGSPKYRAPKTKATILHLMTHTAGFTYDFFEASTLQWRIAVKQDPAVYLGVGEKWCFESPLLHDPGAQYTYGVNIDWLGFVIEAISGMSLNEYIAKNILKPLEMHDSGPYFKEEGKFLAIHMRGEDGSLVANPMIAPGEKLAVYGGGHFLISTLDDYSTFLLTVLNNGTNPRNGAQILKEQTVKEYLFQDHLKSVCSNDNVGKIERSIPALSNVGELLPGVNKTWSTGLMLNTDAVPNGRSAGSGAWAGLGNNYFWLDPQEGKLGLILAGILPFMDGEVLQLFDELERAVYGKGPVKETGETGSNYTLAKLGGPATDTGVGA